jgi:hypothetical protein
VNTVFPNSRTNNANRRNGGPTLVYEPAPASFALIEHFQEMIADASGGRNLETARGGRACAAHLPCGPRTNAFGGHRVGPSRPVGAGPG